MSARSIATSDGRVERRVDASSSTRVDEAIMRVLQAEEAARIAVTDDAAQAERLREEARQRAHAIAERAAVRVARVHGLMDAAITRRLAHIERERAALKDAHPDESAESARMARALDRLAAELAEGRA